MTPFLVFYACLQIHAYARKAGFVVSGMILDPNQAVPGANVTLKADSKPDVRSSIADYAGAFRFDGVRSGEYKVRIELDGFKPYIYCFKVANKAPCSFTNNVSARGQVFANTSENRDTVTMRSPGGFIQEEFKVRPDL